MSKPTRTDKFTYTDPRQIKVTGETDRSRQLRELRDLIVEEGLDPANVIDLVRKNVEQLR